MPYTHNVKESLDCRTWKRYGKLSRWPLALIGEQTFIDVTTDLGVFGPRTRLVPVLDVSRLRDRLLTNRDREGPFAQPREAFAEVGEEGQFALVYLRDGTTAQVIIAYLSVDVRLRTPTGDELYQDV